MQVVYGVVVALAFYLGLVVGWRVKDGSGPLPAVRFKPVSSRRAGGPK